MQTGKLKHAPPAAPMSCVVGHALACPSAAAGRSWVSRYSPGSPSSLRVWRAATVRERLEESFHDNPLGALSTLSLSRGAQLLRSWNGRRAPLVGHALDSMFRSEPTAFRAVVSQRVAPLRLSGVAQALSPMPHTFPIPGRLDNGGADPLVRSRPPGRLFEGGNHLILREKRVRSGSADQ